MKRKYIRTKERLEYYSNGKIKTVTTYLKNGHLDTIWYWRENGILEKEISYRRNNRDHEIHYDENGEVAMHINVLQPY